MAGHNSGGSNPPGHSVSVLCTIHPHRPIPTPPGPHQHGCPARLVAGTVGITEGNT